MASFNQSALGLLKSYAKRNTFYFLLAIAVWCVCGSIPDTLTPAWCINFVVKKQVTLWLWYGGIEYALESPRVRSCVSARKFDAQLPQRQGQNFHDCLFTNLSMLMSSAAQLFVFSYWKWLGIHRGFWDAPVWSLFWIFVTPVLASLHFYGIHRLVHLRRPFDFYTNVHYLHHRSRNPTAWSGMSMHPVESALYLSRASLLPFLVPLFCNGRGLHELHLIFASVHAELTPAIDHHGFEENVTGGSHFHFLHHKLVVKNYGSPLIPFDKLFGTFAA